MKKDNLNKLEDFLHHKVSDCLQQIKPRISRNENLALDEDSLRQIIRKNLEESGQILPRSAEERLITSVVNRIIGLGPIEPLLKDPTISEVMVNRPELIFIEREGIVEQAKESFRDEEHVLHIIDRIISPLGRRIDESMPYVDARLPDGSRVNAIIPPLSTNSPVLTIRRFSPEPFTLSKLVELHSISDQMARFLRASIRSRLNLIISGGTGSGKTSTLNALTRCIPDGERLITIEDVAELRLDVRNLVSLEARTPNLEGKGEVNVRTLVRNALRMRPDRIIIGEVRGAEAFDMLQAMNTGHPGSITTVHANSPADAVRRLESMVLQAGLELPHNAVRDQILHSIDLILQLERLPGGQRKVTEISELVPRSSEIDDREIGIHTIFQFQIQGVDKNGLAHGYFRVNPEPPFCLAHIRRNGCQGLLC